jgi:hypothetical protein
VPESFCAPFHGGYARSSYPVGEILQVIPLSGLQLAVVIAVRALAAALFALAIFCVSGHAVSREAPDSGGITIEHSTSHFIAIQRNYSCKNACILSPCRSQSHSP